VNLRIHPHTARLLGLVLLTAVACAALAREQAEAQVLDTLKHAGQQVEGLLRHAVRCTFDDSKCIAAAKAQKEPVVLTDKEGTVLTDQDGKPITDPEDPPAQTSPGTLQDGRYVATLTSPSGDVHHFGGDALAATVAHPAQFELQLCGGAVLREFRDSAAELEGEYVVGSYGPAQATPKRAVLHVSPVSPWTNRPVPKGQYRGSLIITQASDELVSGTVQVEFGQGWTLVKFDAAFRALRNSGRAIHYARVPCPKGTAVAAADPL
jgi:hypothetical protein